MADTALRPDTGALESLQLKIGGMSCSFCSNAIERGLGREKASRRYTSRSPTRKPWSASA